MAFGLNMAQIIGRLGDDVTVNHLASGGRVANMSIATDESYIDRNGTGDRIDKTEWHRVVTFQDGLVDMLEKHAKKGRLVYVAGKLQTRRWRKDGEDSRPVLDRDPAGPRRSGAVPRTPERRERQRRARVRRRGDAGLRDRFRRPGIRGRNPVLGGPLRHPPCNSGRRLARRLSFCSRAGVPGRAGRRGSRFARRPPSRRRREAGRWPGPGRVPRSIRREVMHLIPARGPGSAGTFPLARYAP